MSGTVKKENRGVTDIEKEASFEGGTEGFIEETSTNINLVRQYYHDPNLVKKNYSIGTFARNNLVILYNDLAVDKNILKMVLEKLKNIDVDEVQSLNGLQQILWKQQILIPRMIVTQRPDRVVNYLSKGKLVMFLSGTATSLVLPVKFHDSCIFYESGYKSSKVWTAYFSIFYRNFWNLSRNVLHDLLFVFNLYF